MKKEGGRAARRKYRADCISHTHPTHRRRTWPKISMFSCRGRSREGGRDGGRQRGCICLPLEQRRQEESRPLNLLLHPPSLALSQILRPLPRAVRRRPVHHGREVRREGGGEGGMDGRKGEEQHQKHNSRNQSSLLPSLLPPQATRATTSLPSPPTSSTATTTFLPPLLPPAPPQRPLPLPPPPMSPLLLLLPPPHACVGLRLLVASGGKRQGVFA